MLCHIVVIFFLGLVSTQDPQTPLQAFVNAPDTVFNWEIVATIKGPSFAQYVVNLTSCSWLTPQDSNVPVWNHYLVVCVPNNLSPDASRLAGIYVDGGDNPLGAPPTAADAMAGLLAVQTGLMVGHLLQIPNEPVYFTAEKPKPIRRTEDAVIAYTWSHYMNNTNEPNWLLRLPMVKSVVKAMDAMQALAPQIGIPVPAGFAIAGASKRGWTTWLTPVVDKRVSVIIPIVMPILNMVNVINKLWRSLGEWSFALKDYQNMNIMKDINTPQFKQMATIIDPIVYHDSLARVPKYLICATGDEFFLPDSPREFWKDVPGMKHLRMVPDAEHSLAGQQFEVIEQVGSFIYMFLNNEVMPPLDYTLVYSNTSASITVKPTATPQSVTLFQATTISTTRRDFRLVICGNINDPACLQPVFWYPTTLSPNSDGSYSATVNAPIYGWTAFLIEVEYVSPSNPNMYIEVTSEVNIVPDIYPYAPFSPPN